MKKILLPALFLTCLAATPMYAQLHDPALTKTASIITPKPLVLVDNQETDKAALILHSSRIKSIDVLKTDASAKYGKKAKDGVVILTLKEPSQLVRMEQIYSKYKISEDHRKLRVLIDGALIPDKKIILADLRDVSKVEVKKQEPTATTRWSFNEDELFLQIFSNKD